MQPTPLFLIVTFVIGLASAITYVPVTWKLIDKPNEAKIEIDFFNDTPHTLCIDSSDWPTRTGTLSSMSESMALLVGEERFPIRDFDTGYCYAKSYTDCSVRVSPGKTITAFIPYKEFNLPQRLWFEPKKLVYPVKATVCE